MYKIFAGIVMLVLVSISGYVWAANYSNPIEGVFKGTYGDTISIEVPSLVSKSPVSSENQNGDLSFQINPSTGYRNFNQLTDLKYGDPVRVEYTEDAMAKNKQMIATIVTKLEPGTIPVGATNGTVVTPVPETTQTVTTTTTTRVNTP